ncbi:MAG: hypothetical protein ACTIMX_02000 [Levilactobacillus brevis]
MRIVCTVKNIRIMRTRNLGSMDSEVIFSDYELAGEFPAYDRLADFMWRLFKEKIIPEGFEIEDNDDEIDKTATRIQGRFWEDGDFYPPTLALLNHGNAAKYLLCCTSKSLATTYQIWFTLDKKRVGLYAFDMKNLHAAITDKDKTYTFDDEGNKAEGFEMFENITRPLWELAANTIMFAQDGTEDEGTLDFAKPRWVDASNILTSLSRDGNKCHLTGRLPDNSYHADMTFEFRELLGDEFDEFVDANDL